METNSKALEASKAVNALLGLGSEDQEALIEVLEDYFTSSTTPENDDDGLFDDDDEEMLLLQGMYKTIITQK